VDNSGAGEKTCCCGVRVPESVCVTVVRTERFYALR
jgi:hypothetical protein